MIRRRKQKAPESDGMAASSLPEPWCVPDEQTCRYLTWVLRREVGRGHPLFRVRAQVVNRCGACDKVLVRVGEGDFGMVHLTWSGPRWWRWRGREIPPWPLYTHTGGCLANELAQSVHGQDHGYP